jgi:hypothetical protein
LFLYPLRPTLGFWAFGLDLGFSFFALPFSPFVGCFVLIKLAEVRKFCCPDLYKNLWAAQHYSKFWVALCNIDVKISEKFCCPILEKNLWAALAW